MLEVDNLMERVTALGWDQLTTEQAAQFQLTTTIASQLPDPLLAITVEPDAEDAQAKIVRINLTLGLCPEPSRPAGAACDLGLSAEKLSTEC